MADDLFASLGMNPDDAARAQAAIRRITKECIDVTRERFRRGERLNVEGVAGHAVVRLRSALVGLGLTVKQREPFILLAAGEILKAYLQNLERTSVKRRVN